MYTYTDPYAPIHALYPMPVRRHIPFVLLRGYLNTDWFVPQDIKTAELSRVFRRGNNPRETTTSYNTRRSRNFNVETIPEQIRADIFHAARLAWKHFTFSSPEPSPGFYQYLGYDGDEQGYFYSHFDNGIMQNGRLFLNTPERALTVIAYPNDDYEGGELIFDNIKDSTGTPLKFKPQRGDVIAFPSHAIYTHQVLPVTKGVRYAITQFIDDPCWFKDFGILDTRQQMILKPLLQSGWAYGHKSNRDQPGGNLYWNKTFDANVPEIAALWKTFTSSQFAYNHILERVYANRQTFTQDGQLHKDTEYRSYTTLIYAMDEWHRDWGGNTEFFDKDAKKIIHTEIPSPWRVIQFRGDTWHRVGGISKLAPQAVRTTLMFKSRSLYELPPEAPTVSNG